MRANTTSVVGIQRHEYAEQARYAITAREGWGASSARHGKGQDGRHLRVGIHVPEQVAVIGVDNDEPICRIAYPPLSSVILNDHQRGYEAAALLDRMMAGQPVPQDTVWVEPAGVVTRASTDIMAIADPAVSAALQYIRQNAFGPLDINAVARHALISRSVLERRFKKLLGRTVHDEITRLRVNRAIELITATPLPLKAIAGKAGFISPAYMSAVFQAKLGRSPGSYRKQTAAPSPRAEVNDLDA